MSTVVSDVILPTVAKPENVNIVKSNKATMSIMDSGMIFFRKVRSLA
jgi:hypothetical protein